MNNDFIAGVALLASSVVGSGNEIASIVSIICSSIVALTLAIVKVYQIVKNRDSVDISKELEQLKEEIKKMKEDEDEK